MTLQQQKFGTLSSNQEERGYKFRFEIEEEFIDDDGEGARRYKYVGNGNTAKEAVINAEKLMTEFDRHVNHSMTELDDKKDLR